MGRLQRIENRLERVINGAFAKAFRAEVQPVEIASAVRRAMDDRAQTIARGRTLVPSAYTVELSDTDFDRLTQYEDDIREELLAAAEEHAESQRYQSHDDFAVRFTKDPALETGVFRIRPAEPSRRAATGATAMSAPAPETHRPPPAAAAEPPHAAVPAPAPAPTPGAPQLYDVERDGTQAPEPAAHTHRDATADDPYADPAEDLIRATRRRERAAYDQPPVASSEPAPPAQLSSTRREPRISRSTRTSDRPWLEIDGDRYPLLGPMAVLGRDTTASIVIPDANVSRRHSEVRVTNDGPHLVTSIRDLGSTNGTWVNGERITSARLQDRDRVTIGQTELTFHAGR